MLITTSSHTRRSAQAPATNTQMLLAEHGSTIMISPAAPPACSCRSSLYMLHENLLWNSLPPSWLSAGPMRSTTSLFFEAVLQESLLSYTRSALATRLPSEV